MGLEGSNGIGGHRPPAALPGRTRTILGGVRLKQMVGGPRPTPRLQTVPPQVLNTQLAPVVANLRNPESPSQSVGF